MPRTVTRKTFFLGAHRGNRYLPGRLWPELAWPHSFFYVAKNNDFHKAQRARYVLRPGVLDKARAEAIGRYLPADDPTQTLEAIRAGLQSGEYILVDVVCEDGRKVGWTVYSFDDRKCGREMLSVASMGKDEADLTTDIIPTLEQIAVCQGCHSIRLHTLRPGLAAKLLKLDWFVSELVMRKNLK